jgi:hypothetical protein
LNDYVKAATAAAAPPKVEKPVKAAHQSKGHGGKKKGR